MAKSDVLIDNGGANPCVFAAGNILPPSNRNIQCKSKTATMLYTNQDNQTPLFKFTNVSNSSLSACPMQELPSASPFGWGVKTSGSNYTSFNFLVLVANYTGPVSNITLTGLTLGDVRGQAAIELYAGAGGPTVQNIQVTYNDFKGCGLYGGVFDGGINSHIDHNYAMDCFMGFESDGANQPVTGDTLDYNYIARDATSTGYGSVCAKYSNGCDGYYSGITTSVYNGQTYAGILINDNYVTGNGFATRISKMTAYASLVTNNQCVAGCQYVNY